MSLITFGLIDSDLLKELVFEESRTVSEDSENSKFITSYCLTKANDPNPNSLTLKYHSRLYTLNQLCELIDRSNKKGISLQLEAGNIRVISSNKDPVKAGNFDGTKK